MTLSGLRPQQTYYVAVRTLSACDAPSPLAVATADTGKQQFTVLHGCFIATAAYGTPLAAEIDALRRFRDRELLDNALGRLFTATYYAVSPPWANAIAGADRLRAGARRIVEPLVQIASAVERARAAANAALK
jgi:hypothetical protein